MLDRMTRAMGRRLPISVAEGMRRPKKPVQAAKLALEAGVIIRQQVPILTHWKEYKQDNSHFKNFIGKLSGRLAVDTKDKPTKDACTSVFQGGVRQNRYKLKKRFFNGIPANEISNTSPVSYMTDEEWRKLVTKWSDTKSKEISEKNKQNRAKVKHHQATGSRSYIAHCYTLRDKYKDQELNAVDIFKECHNSETKGFSDHVQQAITNMETMLAAPVEDAETPRSSTEVVSKVLSQTSANSTFLKNVGLQTSSMKTSTAPVLQEELETERQRAAVLRQTIECQQQKLDALKKQAQVADEVMAKTQEEMTKMQKEMGGIQEEARSERYYPSASAGPIPG